MPEIESSASNPLPLIGGIVVRGRWWILLTGAVATLATVAVLYQIPNRYKSEATLLVVPQQVPARYVTPTTETNIADALQAMTQDVNTNLDDLLEYLDSAIETAPKGAFRLLREADLDGRPLTRQEKRGFGIVLIHAGWETTATAIATMFLRLATVPGLRDRLAGQPGLIGSAIEEFLRIDTPVQAQWRTAACDLDLGGAAVARADKTLLLLGSANRDEAEFPQADEVVVDRMPNRHLAFGVGVHRCLGAHLARLEMQIVLELALERLPAFELDPGRPVSATNGVVRVVHSVPLRFLAG